MTSSLEERLKRLLAEQTGEPAAWDSVNEQTPIIGVGIGLSSLDTISLMVKIEQEFELFFEAEEFAAGLESFGALADVVRKKVQEAAGGDPRTDGQGL